MPLEIKLWTPSSQSDPRASEETWVLTRDHCFVLLSVACGPGGQGGCGYRHWLQAHLCGLRTRFPDGDGQMEPHTYGEGGGLGLSEKE